MILPVSSLQISDGAYIQGRKWKTSIFMIMKQSSYQGEVKFSASNKTQFSKVHIRWGPKIHQIQLIQIKCQNLFGVRAFYQEEPGQLFTSSLYARLKLQLLILRSVSNKGFLQMLMSAEEIFLCIVQNISNRCVFCYWVMHRFADLQVQEKMWEFD